MAKPIRIDYDFGGVVTVTNLRAPVAANDAARLVDLQSAIEGINWKDNVRVATQSNINLASPGATIDSITMVLNDRFLARLQSASLQNGIYIWNGAAVAATRSLDANTSSELENAVVIVDEGSSAGAAYRQTAVNFIIDTDPIAWAGFASAAPPASETVSGIAELATQAETDTGTDDLRIITPLKLANYAGRKRVASANIGDGSSTQYDVTHNFGSRLVHVIVFRNGTPWDDISCDVSRPDTNTVRLNFGAGAAPTSNQFTVAIIL